MPHTYSQNYLHVVFSTKERRKLITKEFQPKLWSYMAGIGRNNGFLVLANGGMEDHAHLLIQIACNTGFGQSSAIAKRELVKMGGRTWMGVFMAGRIRRLQREQIQHKCSREIHRKPGNAPSQDYV